MPDIAQGLSREDLVTVHVNTSTAVLLLLYKRSDICEIPPRRIEPDIFNRAVRSEVVKHAALYFAARLYAAELQSARREVPLRHCLPYKLCAIQTIRNAITSRSSATDENILAVIFMVMSFNQVSLQPFPWKSPAYRSMWQNTDKWEEIENHIYGIGKMIKLRGGVDKLGYDGLIRDLYKWCIGHCPTSKLCVSQAPDI